MFQCVQITQRLERLSLRKEEYYLLKALALSNCDIRLDDQFLLRKFRDSILSALNDCVYIIRYSIFSDKNLIVPEKETLVFHKFYIVFRHTSAVSHQQQLLLLLPSLRQADQIIRKFWTNISRDENVTLNKLFVEMLESVTR